MTVKEIIDLALFRTNTSISSYPKNFVKQAFDRQYKKLYRSIVNADEDFFRTYWTTDILEGATEYSLIRKTEKYIDPDTQEEVIIPWIAKVKKVSVLEWENYVELKQLGDNESWHWWRLKDNHIILTRTPKEEVLWWLKIEGLTVVEELSEEDSDLFPWHADLQDMEYILWLGLEYELWRWKQDFDKANMCLWEYNSELSEILKNITPRVQSIYFSDVR